MSQKESFYRFQLLEAFSMHLSKQRPDLAAIFSGGLAVRVENGRNQLMILMSEYSYTPDDYRGLKECWHSFTDGATEADSQRREMN